MKPLIGITSDMDEEAFRIKHGYVSAVIRAGGMPVVFPAAFSETGDISRIAEMIDGLILPGGGDLPPGYYGEDIRVPPGCLNPVKLERVGFELALLREVADRRKPILGICLGMQLLNVAFGGSLYQDISHQVPDAGDHRRGVHVVTISSSFGSTFNLHPSSFVVNSFHHQAVKSPGAGLEVFASSEDGVIEGVYRADYPFLVGVQWHPERPTPGAANGARPLLLNSRSYDKLSLKIFEMFIEKSMGNRL